MRYYFENGHSLEMTLREAREASHQGRCDAEVKALCATPKMRRQLDKIGAEAIAEELKEYGAWNEEELKDAEANRERFVWVAAGNIVEESEGRGK